MAYISKFTGAQIDDLLDKSKTMGAAVDELAQDVAAKEDVANKVTSISSDADDTHYPSAKAVKTALTNLADGEDLASVGNVMKLADKAYTPTAYSGMGRKYLRKNLVGGKNILTQDMLPSANTIYMIQYDYDLNGATITIPENCTLDFQGGSLGNGNINGNKTIIIAAPYKIFNNVELMGSCSSDIAYAEWFGAVGDDETDDRESISLALKYFTRVHLLDKTYRINSCDDNGVALLLKKGQILDGEVIFGNAIYEKANLNCAIRCNSIIKIQGSCSIKNISIKGAGRNGSSIQDIQHIGISNDGIAYNNNFENVYISHTDCGFSIAGFLTSFKNCYAHYTLVGFYIKGSLTEEEGFVNEGTSINMSNCYCIHARINAYRIVGITYSTFINLCADSCGIPEGAINDASLVYPVYMVRYCYNSNFISIGAEKCFAFITTYLCRYVSFISPTCILDYTLPDNYDEVGTYVPEKVIKLTYSEAIEITFPAVRIGEYLKKINLIDISQQQSIVYIEDSAKETICYFIRNIPFAPFANNIVCPNNIIRDYYVKEYNVYITSNRVTQYQDTYTITEGTFNQALKLIDFKNNPNEVITITSDKEIYYGAENIDLCGKTLIVKTKALNKSYDATSTFSNGKIIFVGVTIYGVYDTTTSKPIFTFNSCEVEFYDSNILRIVPSSSEYSIITNNSFVKLINTYLHLNNIENTTDKIIKEGNYYQEVNTLKYSVNSVLLKGAVLNILGLRFISLSVSHYLLGNSCSYVEQLPNLSNILDYGTAGYFKGCSYFHNNMLKIWDGSKWVDATGATV